MTDTALIWTAASLLLAALAGLGLGLLYFAALRRTAEAFGSASGWRLPAALTVARLLAAIAVFAGIVQFGAGPLLAAFGGFLAARALALRAAREPAHREPA